MASPCGEPNLLLFDYGIAPKILDLLTLITETYPYKFHTKHKYSKSHPALLNIEVTLWFFGLNIKKTSKQCLSHYLENKKPESIR